MPIRYSEEQIRELLKKSQESPSSRTGLSDDPVLYCDVFIAGSGPIG